MAPSQTDKQAAERILQAVHRIEQQARLYGDRCDVFWIRIKNNTRDLTPDQRQALVDYLDRHHERLLSALAEDPEVPHLNLTVVPFESLDD